MAKKELRELQSTCTAQKVSTYCSYYIMTMAEKSTGAGDGQERAVRVIEYLYRTEGQGSVVLHKVQDVKIFFMPLVSKV